MRRTRFLDMVRQYARLASRFRRSYGEQVNTLLDLRERKLNVHGVEGEVWEEERKWALGVVDREYAPYDKEYSRRVL